MSTKATAATGSAMAFVAASLFATLPAPAAQDAKTADQPEPDHC